MTGLLKRLMEIAQDAAAPTTWRVGDHVAKKRQPAFGSEETGPQGYVCVECGSEAETREELADTRCWEEVDA